MRSINCTSKKCENASKLNLLTSSLGMLSSFYLCAVVEGGKRTSLAFISIRLKTKVHSTEPSKPFSAVTVGCTSDIYSSLASKTWQIRTCSSEERMHWGLSSEERVHWGLSSEERVHWGLSSEERMHRGRHRINLLYIQICQIHVTGSLSSIVLLRIGH